jgi:hypothetical protein
MNRIWTMSTFAAALSCAATLFAQTGAGAGTASQTATQPPGSDAHRTVVVVGCVQRAGGTGEVTGTSGVAGASATATTAGNGPSGWILANASTDVASAAGSANAPNSATADGRTTATTNREAGSVTDGAAPVAAGAGGGANRGMSGSTYLLEGKLDVSAHAGHKVEITGTLAGLPNSGAAAASTSSTSTARAESATSQTGTGASGSMTGGQRLTVASVKMISPNCS